MIKSMTAYGRSSKTTPSGRWSVEIHSVNRKFLDISLLMPKDFLAFDIDMRKVLAESLNRGQVTVKVSLVQEGISPEIVKRQVQQLRLVKQLYQQVAKELDLDAKEELTLSFLLEQRKDFTTPDSDEKEGTLKLELLATLKEALASYMKMKEVEGSALSLEIYKYLDTFKSMLTSIEKLAPEASILYKKKMLDRIQEVKEIDPQDEDRIMREVMIYAEKVDIEEEIIRLKSHIAQFEELFSSKEKSVGRTMDFLLQEMNREVNTMCAKSDKTEISLNAVKMKSELEKIREQAQNIE
ncbi:MAG: YicC family protein [Chlamydiae bacterium]|nr:YicC family protein [Chlamydiota bacterium]